jgi:poly-gamma-glutamate capsule biosynthesis protein CapA/YwtB (metallophosphatase superfamily)
MGRPPSAIRSRPARLLGLLVLVGLWAAASLSARDPPHPAAGPSASPRNLAPVTAGAPATARAPLTTGAPVTAVAPARPPRPPAARPPRARPAFTLLASGDVLPHGSVVARARAYAAGSGRRFDFRPMFAAIRPIVAAADLAVCHLETPLAPSGRDLSGYPTFNAPPQLAAAIRGAGYDACSVASNHAMDRGPAGVAATLAVLDRAGLRHAGTARSPREAGPTLLTVRGVRVALLSYTYGLNGFRPPPGRPWLVNRLDPGRILAAARAARRAGSRFTVVFLHWGQEYRPAPTAAQRTLARRLLADPGVDLVLGHHAHVVQPVRRVGGKWVAFGMGNSLSAQSAACCPAATQDGLLLQVRVVERAGRLLVDEVRYTPTWVEHPSYRVLPVPETLASGSPSPATRAALRASLRRTTAAVGHDARPAARRART